MIAFHGQQSVKDFYVQRMKDHIAADELIHGTYWQDGKGCMWGCLLEVPKPHIIVPEKMGIPRIVSGLADNLFERLENGDSKDFALRGIEVIPVGADLSKVYPLISIWEITNPEYGVMKYCKDEITCGMALELVALHQRIIDGGTGSNKEWQSIADLADRAYLAYRAYRADRAYRAYLAYRADRADLADLYHAYRAYRADLADRADRAYRAYRAYRADLALSEEDFKRNFWCAWRDKFLELLANAPVLVGMQGR